MRNDLSISYVGQYSARTQSVRVRVVASRVLRKLGLSMVGLMVCAGTAFSETYSAHTDLEFRLGLGVTCGTCDESEGFTSRWKGTAQFFADRLFPLVTIGPGVVRSARTRKQRFLTDWTFHRSRGDWRSRI